MSEGPMSSRTTVAVLLGSMAAAGLAFWMGWGSERRPRTELQECQAELALCESRTYECDLQPTNPPDLEPWEDGTEEKAPAAPTRQPLSRTIARIPLFDISEEEESIGSPPPEQLDAEAEAAEARKHLLDYLADPAPDGEVMPGPLADDAEWKQ